MPEWYDKLLEKSLPAFIEKTLSTVDPASAFLPNWHINLIAEYLEAARRAEVTRLIINMPPRSLKSVCVSVAWPAWLLGHDPRTRIIASSYASSLSVKHSLDSRLLVSSPWYQRVFPEVRLTHDQNQKHKFITTKRGFRLASSVGASVIGEGGNFLIVDDPISPAQAMNKTYREFVRNWFEHTFSTRLDNKEKGVIVLVMQRLHQDDLSGYLLNKGGWEHLCLPAIATCPKVYNFGNVKKERETGEALHNERENIMLVERAKKELGSTTFAAQYQQSPLMEEGGMVRRSWIGRYHDVPESIERIVQSWDTAIKTGASNDPSVCLTFAESSGKSYLLEARVVRLEYPDLKKLFYEQAKKHNPHAILLEDKASGQQLLQDIKRESHLPILPNMPKSDKVTRFAAVSSMIEAGKLVLPVHAPWLVDFEAELFSFPEAVHDDQVDALTQYLDWRRKQTNERMGVRSL